VTIYTFPGEPIPKGRPRMTKTGHVYTPKRTERAEDEIRWLLKSQGAKLTGEPVYLTAAFDSKYTADNVKAPDLDNLIKLVQDAAQGLLFENDRQVVEIHAYLERGAEKPETRLIVEPIEIRHREDVAA